MNYDLETIEHILTSIAVFCCIGFLSLQMIAVVADIRRQMKADKQQEALRKAALECVKSAAIEIFSTKPVTSANCLICGELTPRKPYEKEAPSICQACEKDTGVSPPTD